MADFTWTPDAAYKKEVDIPCLVSQFENGVEQRRVLRGKRYAWELTFTNRSQAEADAILAFFESKDGMATSFTFRPPDEAVDYTVRFLDPKLARMPKSFNVYDVTLTLIQDL
jgi:phage-related protein